MFAKGHFVPGAEALPLVWKGLVDMGSGAIPAATKGFVDGAAKTKTKTHL